MQAVTNFGLRCYEDLFHKDGAVDLAKIDALLGQAAPESPAMPRVATPQVLILGHVQHVLSSERPWTSLLSGHG